MNRDGKPRPSVIVQSDLFNETHESVVVCPATSDLTGYHLFRAAIRASAASGLRHDSDVMVDKITALQRGRIRQRVGRLTKAQLGAVEGALRGWLELQTDLATLPS